MDVAGVQMPDLPEGVVMTEGIVLLKGLDHDGSQVMYVRHSEGLMLWDRLGMLEVAAAHSRHLVIQDDD